MKRIGLAAIMAAVMVAGAAAQPINSDPEFIREGQEAYACTSPKGQKATCNKWLVNKLRGWKRVCAEPDKPIFGGRIDNNNLPVEIEHPDSGCVMVFDSEWADFRRWDKPNQEREQARSLRPAYFRQLVEVHEAGTYQLSTCMVRSVHEVAEDDQDNRMNLGGINVSLLQWHPTGGPTVHAILPNSKAKYGADGLDGTQEHFDLIVDDINHLTGELPRPIVIGEQQTHDTYAVSSMGNVSRYDSWGKARYFVDGYDAHAGLTQPYEGNGQLVIGDDGFPHHSLAGWTCYEETMPLDPGFYLIKAEVYPTFYGETTDYQGWGAIQHIGLTRINN